jgi:hypothetical protein
LPRLPSAPPQSRLRVPRWQQVTSCHDASASSPLDDFLRQTSVAAGPGTRTLRRYRHDLGVRGEGAGRAAKTPPIFSLSPPRSHGAPQSGGRRLGGCLPPNCSVINENVGVGVESRRLLASSAGSARATSAASFIPAPTTAGTSSNPPATRRRPDRSCSAGSPATSRYRSTKPIPSEARQSTEKG